MNKKEKVKRNILEIDTDRCTGCGKCEEACEENAINITEGICQLKGECFCHGHGICVDECPNGALRIVERECEDFEENEAKRYTEEVGGDKTVERAFTHYLHARKNSTERY